MQSSIALEPRRQPPSRDQAVFPGEDEIETALARGDADAALALLRESSRDLPEARRLLLHGRALLQKGDHAGARRKISAAQRAAPRDANIRYWLGRAHLAGGAAALAAQQFRAARLAGLETADLHYHFALAQRDMGALVGRLHQQPWEDQNKPPQPGERLGNGIVVGPAPKAGDRVIVASDESALFEIGEALRLAPARGDILLLAGQLWFEAGQHQVALGYFEKAAGRLEGAELAACHDAWARACLADAQLDEYLEHARTAMQIAGREDAAKLAQCYERAAEEAGLRGQLSRQIQYLKIAVETRPDVDRCIRLADLLLAAQRPGDAARYLELARQNGPNREQARAIRQRELRTGPLATPARR